MLIRAPPRIAFRCTGRDHPPGVNLGRSLSDQKNLIAHFQTRRLFSPSDFGFLARGCECGDCTINQRARPRPISHAKSLLADMQSSSAAGRPKVRLKNCCAAAVVPRVEKEIPRNGIERRPIVRATTKGQQVVAARS
jgi:hypothetical protein